MFTLEIIDELFDNMTAPGYGVFIALVLFTPVVPMFAVLTIIEAIIRFGWLIIKTIFGINSDKSYYYYD